MPRARAKSDPPRECQGCHHSLSRANFRLSHTYCNKCYKEFSGAIQDAVAERVGAHDAGTLSQLQQVLEANDPDMPQVMSKVIELYGGHEALAYSIVLMMARNENRYQGGKILTHKEAEALGYLTPPKKPELHRQCIKMLFDSMHGNDVFKRGGNPYDGVSVSDMEAQINQVAWDQMDKNPKYQQLMVKKLWADFEFRKQVFGHIKATPELMRDFNEAKAIIPATATTMATKPAGIPDHELAGLLDGN